MDDGITYFHNISKLKSENSVGTHASAFDLGDIIACWEADLGIHVLVHVRKANVNVVPVPACSICRTGEDSIVRLVRFGDCDNRKKRCCLRRFVVVWGHGQRVTHWG
jgi:hypothetical protein